MLNNSFKKLSVGFSFYLKKSKIDKGYIWISYRFDNQRLLYSTGISINPIFWNSKKGKTRRTANGKTYEYAMEVNNRLNAIENTTEKVYHELKTENGNINTEIFKRALDFEIKGIVRIEEKPKEQTFFT